jgi:hypothetical protein
MKRIAILSFFSIAFSALAEPKIEVIAVLSGAPASEATPPATGQQRVAELKLPRHTATPGRKGIIQIPKEIRYPTAGGAVPKDFETRNIGPALVITTHLAEDGFITFDGYLSVSRLASNVQPTENNRSLTASTVIARETHFTGQARPGELTKINIGERGRDVGELKLTLIVVE